MFSQTDHVGTSHIQIRTAKLASAGQDSSVLCVAGGGCFCLLTCCPSDGHLGGFLFGAVGIGLPSRTPNIGHLWCPCSVGEAVVSVLLALPPGQRSCSQTHSVGGPVWRDLSFAVQGLHRRPLGWRLPPACLPPSPSFQLFVQKQSSA